MTVMDQVASAVTKTLESLGDSVAWTRADDSEAGVIRAVITPKKQESSPVGDLQLRTHTMIADLLPTLQRFDRITCNGRTYVIESLELVPPMGKAVVQKAELST